MVFGAGSFRAEGRRAVTEYRDVHRPDAVLAMSDELALGAMAELGGDELKTAPRGYAKDHPRIDLLRKRSLVVSQDYHFAEFVRTAQLLDRVRSDWESARPLIDWITGRLPG